MRVAPPVDRSEVGPSGENDGERRPEGKPVENLRVEEGENLLVGPPVDRTPRLLLPPPPDQRHATPGKHAWAAEKRAGETLNPQPGTLSPKP